MAGLNLNQDTVMIESARISLHPAGTGTRAVIRSEMVWEMSAE